MRARRSVTAGAVVIAGLAVAAGAYLQWWHGPSFAERLDAIRDADFVVNTAFTLGAVDGDTTAEAVRQGYGTVRVNFEGPDAIDTYMITLYSDAEDATAAFERLRSTAAHPILPRGGFFDDNGGFCNRSASTYMCGALFGNTAIRGIAAARTGDERETTLDNAETLLQAAVKNLYQVRLDSTESSHPFIVSVGLALSLLLAVALWRAVTAPGIAAPLRS